MPTRCLQGFVTYIHWYVVCPAKGDNAAKHSLSTAVETEEGDPCAKAVTPRFSVGVNKF